MQQKASDEAWPGDAWAFGGVSIQVPHNSGPKPDGFCLDTDLLTVLQSLQAELAAEQEKHTLLQQAEATLHPHERQCDVDMVSEETQTAGAVKDQAPQADSLPPKAPVPLNQAKPKQPPLRSLSWGGSPKPCPKPSQQPQRRSTFDLIDYAAAGRQQGLSQGQPVQQQVIQQWLCQEQNSAAASDAVDTHCVRQEVLQEVLQAVTLSTKTSTDVDFNNLTVQVHS